MAPGPPAVAASSASDDRGRVRSTQAWATVTDRPRWRCLSRLMRYWSNSAEFTKWKYKLACRRKGSKTNWNILVWLPSQVLFARHSKRKHIDLHAEVIRPPNQSDKKARDWQRNARDEAWTIERAILSGGTQFGSMNFYPYLNDISQIADDTKKA